MLETRPNIALAGERDAKTLSLSEHIVLDQPGGGGSTTCPV